MDDKKQDQLPKQLLKNPSGFPDFGPGEAIALAHMLDVIRKHYERAGYSPIETPLVERPEVLSAKSGGEISAQVYGLRLMNPATDSPTDTKDLALRFDQTVPLARFVAANYGALPFPFRRYVIGPVFRGERPKDGRYRQFIQADIDVIGDGELEIIHDSEMVGVIYGIFTELLKDEPFTVRIGNRRVLQGLLEFAGLKTKESIARASNAIDKMEKIGRASVIELLVEIGIETDKAEDLVKLLTEVHPTDETLQLLSSKRFNENFERGVSELVKVVEGVRALKVPEDRFCVDISIARGLDYYTGTVYETRFDAHPDLGSIASGGRYDDLANAFVDRDLPGVGISIGVTRLILRLIKAGLMSADKKTVAPVLVTSAAGAQEYASLYLGQAALLREANIATEVYLAEKPLGKQMQFANRRGFLVAVITRSEQIEKGEVTVRNLKTGDQEDVPSDELVETIQKMLI